MNDPSAERSRKFKRELQNCLTPYHEIYSDRVKTSKQIKITNFLKKIESAKNLNEEKNSENKGHIVQLKKCSRLIILSSNEKEIY